MRSAVASGRSSVVASSSGAPTAAAPRPMRQSNLPSTATTTTATTTAIVAPASLSLSGPGRGHCAGASRLGRSKVRFYAGRHAREGGIRVEFGGEREEEEEGERYRLSLDKTSPPPPTHCTRPPLPSSFLLLLHFLPIAVKQLLSQHHRAPTTAPLAPLLQVATAAADGAALPPLPSSSSAASSSSSPSPSLPAFLQAFWKFLRPHTIRGTVLGSLAVTARSLLEQGAPLASLDWAGLAPRAALGVLALLAGNGFIVGINQIYDVEIDVVNKPFLPVAAGELSPRAAWALVVALAAAGVALSWGVFGREIGILYAFGLTLGAVYSVPPFRLKTKPVPAFLIIATVRGFLLNFGVYSAVRAALGLQFIWSPAMVRKRRGVFFFFFFFGGGGGGGGDGGGGGVDERKRARLFTCFFFAL